VSGPLIVFTLINASYFQLDNR